MAEILIESDEFSITLFDLYMYLQPQFDPQSERLDWGSDANIREGLQQLYALKVLRLRADRQRILSEAQRRWTEDYGLTMELVPRLLSSEIDREVSAIDLEQLAREYYAAHPSEFVTPETLTIRTLLVKTDCMSTETAIAEVEDYAAAIASDEDFERLIQQRTDDQAARESGGLMRIVPGDTVKPFEEAAFALQEPGAMSGPVESEFGVHLIRLISRQAPKQTPYSAVREEIIARLLPKERNKVLDTLRMEAREYRPEGLELRVEKLRSLFSEDGTVILQSEFLSGH